MNIAEDTIPEDTIPEEKDTGMSPDDLSVSSNDDQGYDLDELSSLLTDEAEVSMQAETLLAKDVSDGSAHEELEVLSDSSAEATTDDPESVYGYIPALEELEVMHGSSNESAEENSETVSSVEESIIENESTGYSVLEELEAMYDSSKGSTGENSEAVSNIEESISENESTGDSVLEELEALLSGDSVESLVNSVTDEVETLSEAAEHSFNESETSAMPALDELKAFLGETTSNEDGESDDTYASNDEYSIASRRSIFDELQNLLQSCIDELTAATEGSSVASILSTEVDYPSHYELKNLLETKLSQLMKFSVDSASTDYVADGASVLDELSNLLGEPEINNSENVSDASVSLDEVDEYVSSIESDHESSNDETVATDSVLDELKELLGESDDMGTEIPVSSSASDYSVADVSEETSLLDPLDDLLSEPGETDDPVLVSDSSSVSVLDAVDTDKNENEKSVLEEFAAYMDGSSDLPGVGIEAPEQETETASAFDESDTLKQLEAMLNESSAYTDEKSSETIQLNEHDSSIEYAAPQLSGNNEEAKHKDVPTVNDRVRPADVKAEKLIQDSLAETKNNNRMPIVGMSLLAVAVIGAIAFWNLSADQESNHSLARQNMSLDTTEIVKAKSDFIAQPVIVEAEPWRQAEVKPAEYETEPSYKNETYDSYEKAQYDLYEEPAPYDVYEPLNNEVIDPVLEVDELQMQQPDVVPQVGNEITENRIIELIVEQIQLAQNNNETSIALEDNTSLLSERLTAVELSISELQFSIEKTQQLQFARPANPDTSKVNTEDQIKQVQEKTEKNFDLLNGRVTDTESSVSNLQHAVEEMQQRVAMSPVSPDASTVATVDQIKQLQDENKNNLSLLNKHFVAVEASISKLQYAVEEMQQRVAMSPVSADTSLKATENQITRVQEKNEKSFGLLNERVIDTESSISKLQLAVEKYKQLGPVQSVSSIASKMNTAYSSKLAAGELTDQTYTIWSVHLLSFYGKPPPVGELDFLDDAGVPYKIKRTIVKGGVWYRVLVNNSSEYGIAKEYAEMLKARLGIKEIWLSKKQYTYD